MAFEVITHGGGEGLVYTFNAVAALFNGKRALGSSLVYIAGSFATAMMVMTMVIKQELLPSIKWFVGSMFMMSALMVPKVNIIVKDRITKLEQPVANVPYMLGTFAGIASQLGDIVARQFDGIFSKVGGNEVMNYHSHGVAMASQLVAKAGDFTIPNADAAANVRAFVQNCMVFDIAKGKYTIQELLDAPDVWGFLAENASPIRGFPYKLGKKKTKILTCKEAVNGSEEGWKQFVNEAARRYGPQIYPHSPNAGKAALELLANLEVSYDYLTGLSLDAATILKQNMMRNAIKDSLLELNQIHDASAAVTGYAVARAQAQQKTAYALQGSMASLALSTLKIVIEVLFYGLFPVIVAIAIFPGGLTIVKKYGIALFWIQSWAPMYSILNMLVNVYRKAKSMAAVTVASGKGVLALSTIGRLGEANEWVSAVAGYAMMSVPFLSYGIIHYGAGALSQLATHFGGITQSSASQAAEEATTVNYNIGNTSFDNHNRSNVNAFKYDTNTSIAAGKTSVQDLDGSQYNMMADGSYTVNRDPSISKLGATLNISEGMSGSLNEGAEISHRAGMQYTQQAIESRAAALQQFRDAKQQRAHNISNGEVFSANDQVFYDSALAKQARIAEDIEKRYGVNSEVANNIVAEGNLNLGKVGAGLNAGINKRDTTLNSSSMAEAIRYAEDQGVTENWRQAESETRENRYSMTDSLNRSSASGITASLNDSVSHQKMASASFNEEEAYRKSAQIAEHLGTQFNQDMSQVFLDGLVKKRGIEEAKRIISNPELLRREGSGFIHAQAESLRNTIKSNSEFTFSDKELNGKYQSDLNNVVGHNDSNKAFSGYYSAVNNNVAPQLNESINPDVKARVDEKRKEVSTVIERGKSHIAHERQNKSNEFAKYKEDNKVSNYAEITETVRSALQPDLKKNEQD